MLALHGMRVQVLASAEYTSGTVGWIKSIVDFGNGANPLVVGSAYNIRILAGKAEIENSTGASVTGKCTIVLEYLSGGWKHGFTFYTDASKTIAGGADWSNGAQLSKNFTVPAGTTKLRVKFYYSKATGNGTSTVEKLATP